MARGGCPSLPGRRRAALAALAGAAAALIAGCGGSGHHRAVAATVTPAALLSQSLGSASAIDSGHLDVALQLTLDGVRQLGGRPVALELSGPFVRSPDHRYSTDLTLTLTAGAAHVRAGLVVVGRAVYLGLGGQFYRLATRSAPTGGATGVTGPTGPTGATGMSAQSAGLWRSLG